MRVLKRVPKRVPTRVPKCVRKRAVVLTSPRGSVGTRNCAARAHSSNNSLNSKHCDHVATTVQCHTATVASNWDYIFSGRVSLYCGRECRGQRTFFTQHPTPVHILPRIAPPPLFPQCTVGPNGKPQRRRSTTPCIGQRKLHKVRPVNPPTHMCSLENMLAAR